MRRRRTFAFEQRRFAIAIADRDGPAMLADLAERLSKIAAHRRVDPITWGDGQAVGGDRDGADMIVCLLRQPPLAGTPQHFDDVG